MQLRSIKQLKFAYPFATLVTLLAAGTQGAGAQTQLVWPMGGTPFHDWVIGNYVDIDTRPIARGDYRGGKLTYDGHDALDIGLAHFRAMEEGVDVYAAKSGTITSANDGAYDRWSAMNPAPPGEAGNLVVIDHGNGLTTLYGHLKKDSVAVNVGDIVAAGQVIGQVGSSGQSTGPHLHFTVRQNGKAVETFESPDEWWDNPLPYTGDVAGVLDSGVASEWPTQAEIEYGVVHEAFLASDGSTGRLAVMWNYVHGVSEGSQVNVVFRRPDGGIHANYAWIQDRTLGVGYWQHGTVISGSQVGTWNAELRVNGIVISNKPFLLAPAIPEPVSITLVGTISILFSCLASGRFRRLNDRRSCF
ncbi:M23 family metallopeptidase [Botrimarina mediterranea]|uniref:M23 family metallopeptidase n=1 Tax=Botrimarina mediterranea TaxID=2528022 RepID=UPI00118A65D9|nr:Murein hydrolase activator EnvC precursor [Planctomycetes bacterium K2D]